MSHNLSSRMFNVEHRNKKMYVDVGFERNVFLITIFDDVYGIKIVLKASLFDGSVLSEDRYVSSSVCLKKGGEKKIKDDNYCEYLLSSLVTRALFNKRIKNPIIELLVLSKENMSDYHKKIQEKNNKWVEGKIKKYDHNLYKKLQSAV